MSGAQVADGFDRLPWLADESPPPAKGRIELAGWASWAGWAVAAVLLIAGFSYWLGRTSFVQSFPRSTTLQLPTARSSESPNPATIAAGAEPVSESMPTRAINEHPRPPRSLSRRGKPARTPVRGHELPAIAKRTPAPPAALPLWPARVVDGAAGRLVRIGVFVSPRQAKQGWWGIVRMNPALQRLPAVVVPVRSLQDGRVYYRLQMGTSSQAHSEVLCQRMRMVAVSCVVVGLNNSNGRPAA